MTRLLPALIARIPDRAVALVTSTSGGVSLRSGLAHRWIWVALAVFLVDMTVLVRRALTSDVSLWDEGYHLSYLQYAHGWHVPRPGEEMNTWARELYTCNPVPPFGGVSTIPCGGDGPDGLYPDNGRNSAAGWPPIYYFVVANLMRPLLAFGVEPVTSGRLVSASIWAAGAALVAVLVLSQAAQQGPRSECGRYRWPRADHVGHVRFRDTSQYGHAGGGSQRRVASLRVAAPGDLEVGGCRRGSCGFPLDSDDSTFHRRSRNGGLRWADPCRQRGTQADSSRRLLPPVGSQRLVGVPRVGEARQARSLGSFLNQPSYPYEGVKAAVRDNWDNFWPRGIERFWPPGSTDFGSFFAAEDLIWSTLLMYGSIALVGYWLIGGSKTLQNALALSAVTVVPVFAVAFALLLDFPVPPRYGASALAGIVFLLAVPNSTRPLKWVVAAVAAGTWVVAWLSCDHFLVQVW